MNKYQEALEKINSMIAIVDQQGNKIDIKIASLHNELLKDIEVEVKKPGEGVHGKDQKDQQNETLIAMGEYWLVETLEEFIQLLMRFGTNKKFIKN